MDLTISFILFIAAMIGCLVKGITMVAALIVGLILFIGVAIRRGHKLSEVITMGIDGLKDALLVILVMFVIGFITGIWRTSGTIAFFVYYGIKLITPSMFLVITFVLCCLLSYALGTSFGVAGTVGVIFMTLARTGNVNEIITAGVIMSGIYFGDRNSPVSSSAILVAGITHTDIIDNVKLMVKTGIVPWTITLIIYGVLSFEHPIKAVDDSFLKMLGDEFSVSYWTCIPAVLMILLPLLKVKVLNAMIFSIISGIAVSYFVQGSAVDVIIKSMIFGYKSTGGLDFVMNGGGMLSMIEVVFIVGLSCMYSGIFAGTKMLEPMQTKITAMADKIGVFPAMVITSFITLGVFCNQTIATMMCNDLNLKCYNEGHKGDVERAIDMENSVIVLAGIVPWTIACSVPLGFMQVGFGALGFCYFIYLIPICYCIQKKVMNPFRKIKDI